MARLIVRQGGNVGDIHDLTKTIVTLGRDEGCGIRLDVEGVSRNHAQIFKEDDAWIVTDLMSKNGTIVNGETVEQRTLRDGDALKLGDVVLVFSAAGSPPPPAPKRGGSP